MPCYRAKLPNAILSTILQKKQQSVTARTVLEREHVRSNPDALSQHSILRSVHSPALQNTPRVQRRPHTPTLRGSSDRCCTPDSIRALSCSDNCNLWPVYVRRSLVLPSPLLASSAGALHALIKCSRAFICSVPREYRLSQPYEVSVRLCENKKNYLIPHGINTRCKISQSSIFERLQQRLCIIIKNYTRAGEIHGGTADFLLHLHFA